MMAKEVNEKMVDEKPKLTADYFKKYHFGREQAVYCAELQMIFRLSDKEIRDKVNAMRMAGEPICSGNCGYWYAACKKDIEDTIHALEMRMQGMENAKRGLLGCLNAGLMGES